MILVTGGAGYIGSFTNKALTKKGYKTVVLDNLSTGHRELVKWGTFEEGCLSSKERLQQLFREYDIKAVMHFAASSVVSESVTNPSKFYLNNIANSLNLIETAKNAGVKNFVFSSTCATYGIPGKIPIDEEQPQAPINTYGFTKYVIEQILKDYSSAYGVNYVALRYFNASGADLELECGEWHKPESHLIPLVLDAAIGKIESIKIFGTDYNTPDGTCIRDYIHIKDLADAHILALEYLLAGEKSNVFNLGNGKGFSVKEIIEHAKRITKIDFKVENDKKRDGDPPVLIGDSKKASEILGWKPNHFSIEEIIESAWNWHKILYENYKK
jgi:UDP-glucose 4-epimerase